MEKYACIIIWYKPSYDVITKWFNTIQNQNNMDVFVIVDNTPIQSLNEVPNINWANTIYVSLKNNVGIAEAQNIGITKAMEMGIDYFFFFDQDSIIPDNYFIRMINAYKIINKDIQAPLILGPIHKSINQHINYKEKSKCKINNYSVVDSVLSSGSLMNTEVINKVGPMNSALFIDQVDHEYCFRASSQNIPTIIYNEVELPHQIGEKVVRFLGANFIISSPFRYYYQFRNAIILTKLHYVPKHIKRKIFIRRVVEFFVQPIINFPKTITVLRHIVRGVFDGINYKI